MTQTQIDEMLYQLRRLESCDDDQRVMTATAKLKQAKAAALADRKDAIAKLNNDIEAARESRYARLKVQAERWPKDCPTWAQEAAVAFYGGTTWRDKVRVAMWDNEARLVWLHVPGHSSWSGRGETSYGQTRYTLVNAEGSLKSHQERDARTLAELQGRVSKKQMSDLILKHK